jgi:hypothetical protein
MFFTLHQSVNNVTYLTNNVMFRAITASSLRSEMIFTIK